MFIQGHVKEDSRKKRMYVCVGVTLVYQKFNKHCKSTTLFSKKKNCN